MKKISAKKRHRCEKTTEKTLREKAYSGTSGWKDQGRKYYQGIAFFGGRIRVETAQLKKPSDKKIQSEDFVLKKTGDKKNEEEKTEEEKFVEKHRLQCMPKSYSLPCVNSQHN